MKTLRFSILFLFLVFSYLAFAVNLPSFPFYGVNELYEANHDNIEISAGTRIGNINLQIQTVNSSWGEICLGKGEQRLCQDCCKESLFATKQVDGSYNTGDVILYTVCMKDCGGGPSLPLGSTLWLLPFAFAYASIRIKNLKTNI